MNPGKIVDQLLEANPDWKQMEKKFNCKTLDYFGIHTLIGDDTPAIGGLYEIERVHQVDYTEFMLNVGLENLFKSRTAQSLKWSESDTEHLGIDTSTQGKTLMSDYDELTYWGGMYDGGKCYFIKYRVSPIMQKIIVFK